MDPCSSSKLVFHQKHHLNGFIFLSSPLHHNKALVLQAVQVALSLEKEVPFSITHFHPVVAAFSLPEEEFWGPCS